MLTTAIFCSLIAGTPFITPTTVVKPLGSAQTGRDGQPLNWITTSSLIPPQGTANYKGITSEPLTSDMRLQVRVHRPDGVVDTMRVVVDKDGGFSFNVLPKMTGKFMIDVIGYNGRLIESRTLQVSPWNVCVPTVTQRIEKIRQHTRAIVDGGYSHVNSRPSGRNRDEAHTKLAELKRKFDARDKMYNHISAALTQLQALATTEPRLAAQCGEAMSAATQWATDSLDEEQRLERMATRFRSASSNCDGLEMVAEGLQLVNNVMLFVTEPHKVFVNILNEKVLPAADNTTNMNDNAKFAVSEIRKEGTAALEGFSGLVSSLLGLTGDIAGFITNKLFADYCSVIEGDVKADFSVDAKDKGKSYWKYSVKLAGKMKMWADKGTAADDLGTPYHGRIVGSTTKLEFFEDVFVIEPAKGAKILLRKKIMPPVVPMVDDPLSLGQPGRAALPGSFNVRYLAWLNENRMSFKQEHVSFDFTDKYKNVLALAFLPQGGLIPAFRMFDFPIQKAAWIIDRTTKGPFEVPVQDEGGKKSIKKTFTREETTASGVNVKFMVDYDLKPKV